MYFSCLKLKFLFGEKDTTFCGSAKSKNWFVCGSGTHHTFGAFLTTKLLRKIHLSLTVVELPGFCRAKESSQLGDISKFRFRYIFGIQPERNGTDQNLPDSGTERNGIPVGS